MLLLSEISGQHQAIAQLQKDLLNGTISHAYLFCGPKGVGKKTTALAWARALVCSGGKRADACAGCRVCNAVSENRYPGVELLEPVGAHYKIEQIREVQRKCYYTGFEGDYRVFIIPAAERLTPQAANSLLKLLEEPPAGNVFILTTAIVAAMLPTVISRCRIVKFNSLPAEIIKEKLMTTGQNEQEAEYLSRVSTGSMADALKIAESGEALSCRQNAEELLEKIWQGKEEQLIAAARSMEKAENLDELLNQLIFLARDYLIWATAGDISLLINRDKLENIKKNTEARTSTVAGETLKELLLLKRRLKQNVNKRLAVDVMVWKIHGISQAF